MASYNFKKEVSVYIVHASNEYNIDVSDISFSQTFQEKSYPVKTLQTPSMFEASIIKMANPANFNFTFPAIREDDLRVVFDRALDVDVFDLYVETPVDIFFIDNCVITEGSFIIEKTRPLSMSISGEATQISLVANRDTGAAPVARDVNRTYNRNSAITVELDSVDVSDFLTAITVDLKNNIEWTPYMTLDAICPQDSTIVYPVTFTVKDRELSGNIVNYLTDTNDTDLQSAMPDVPLHIEAGQLSGGTVYGFDVNIANCFVTNRLNTGSIFSQIYEWRMTENPTLLSDVITYTVL